MRFQDLCVKKTYYQNNEEKATWLKVGTIRTNNEGKQFIELNLLPETTIYVFDRKEKETGSIRV